MTPIDLRPMSAAEYQAYVTYAVAIYAKEKVEAGNWTSDEAVAKSEKSFTDLLPEGLATAGHHLFTLVNAEGDAVGFLWYRLDPVKPTTAFVFDFEIAAPFQRRGYATAALDDHARAHGATRLELHVFASNAAARGLYAKAGFHETNVQMAKNLR
jgi:ribosomal protein S18 acetylase RimI-like enzyme